MLIQYFMACSTDIKMKLFHSFCCNLCCAQLWYNSNKTAVVKMCTAYNEGLHRLILYKLDIFLYSVSEMFVANNDSLDVLIRKSLHGFYTHLLTCVNHKTKCQITFSSVQVVYEA